MNIANMTNNNTRLAVNNLCSRKLWELLKEESQLLNERECAQITAELRKRLDYLRELEQYRCNAH